MKSTVNQGRNRIEALPDHPLEPPAAPPDPPAWIGTVFDTPELAPFAPLTLPEIAATASLRRIEVVAWRDFDDPEAGGSELHAHRILSAWSKAGLEIEVRTSAVPDASSSVVRDGYRVTRRMGRYAIFPRTIASGLLGHIGRADGLVEIWNGMPFFSPLWARCPRVVFLHHVHAEMWKMVLPRGMADVGDAIEHRFAPPVYKKSRIITLSSSSKDEIVEQLGLPARNVTVVPPGIESQFSPGTERSEVPLVVAVGRLVPHKRFDLLIESLVRLRSRHPDLRAVIAGEGYERSKLEALVRTRGAEDWISLPGYVDGPRLVELYRTAWVVASASLREGWGMTLTEAGASGTPSVVTDIAGHRDAVVEGETGYLVDDLEGMVSALDAILSDEVLRKDLGIGASERALGLNWDATARATLAVLASEALRARGKSLAATPAPPRHKG